jgi:26S proteasome regulatory subunit N1
MSMPVLLTTHYYITSLQAIIGLGLVAAGTNNSRVAQLLRQLSEFYSREPGPLFTVRIAQGLNHMGKGLMTLHPFHSDRLVLSPVALGGVLTMLIACLDMKNTILDKVSCSIVVLPVVALPILAVAL